MELIEVINSSLIIFFVSLSVTTAFSYISYKIKERSKPQQEKNALLQTETHPVGSVLPRMIVVNGDYRIPGEKRTKTPQKKLNIFSFYSINRSEKMHKLKLYSKQAV